LLGAVVVVVLEFTGLPQGTCTTRGWRGKRRKEKGGVEKNGGIEEGRKEGKGQAELK